jgi:undecaprenyl-diphosphatase
MVWDKITDIILIAAFGVLATLGILGLYQWVTRKSLKKVDRALLAMFVPLALMAAVYLFFDKVWIVNTRPNGSGEASFPSTHTMIVATIFLCTVFLLPKYVKQKAIYVALDILMYGLIVLTALGRVFSNMHWPTDVAAGLGFAAVFAFIYFLIAKERKK